MCFWDVDSGELIDNPFGRDAGVSQDSGNTIVVMNRDDAVDEWGTDICERMHGLSAVDIGHITSVLNDSSKYCAIGFEDGAIQLWERRERTAVFEPLKGHSGKVLALVTDQFKSDYLASGSEDQTIIIWDPERREMKLPPLKGHSGPITSLASVNLKTLGSGSLDGTVRLWDVSTGVMLHAFTASEMGSVYSVACYDNRLILSGSEDGIIRMWDTEHREMPPKKFVGHTDKVISLAIDYDNRGRRFASGSSDGTVRVWDIEREREIVEGSMGEMAVSPNGEYLVSGSSKGTVSVWRIGTGELINGPLEGHNSSVTSLSFSPDGSHFASGSFDGTVRIWNLGGESVTCSTEGQRVWAICFSPDGKHVASSGTDKPILVWDSQNGRLALEIFEGHSKLVVSICYSPDGNRIVSGSRDENICIWDALDGTLLQTLPDQATSVKCSHDGSYIISVSVPEDGTIRFWDANNGKPIREPIKVQVYFMSTIYFSPDDTYFVSKSLENCRVWNMSTGRPLFEVNLISPGSSFVFLPSSDSKYIKFASSSDEDGLIRIYCVDIDSKGTISDAPDEDGWLVGNDGNLLSWVPSGIRHSLIYGSCVRILNSQFTTKLTLSKYQGSQWTSCFPSSDIV
ncbi:WD40 domain containing protein [Pyrrhoderma noxium]|uniref:WD40 domain containing protein n=1 Tax=Pyrrhoderma noxium TaxID=2282107 RepID=A0A286U5M4_9AGAM|nr:WD40 domain containing protein [Pyrrhoderma noxium]